MAVIAVRFVPINKWMVLRQTLKQRRNLLDQIRVVASLRTRSRSLQCSAISYTVNPAIEIHHPSVDFDDLLPQIGKDSLLGQATQKLGMVADETVKEATKVPVGDCLRARLQIVDELRYRGRLLLGESSYPDSWIGTFATVEKHRFPVLFLLFS